MEVKVKEAAFYIRKYLLFSLESTYRFACRHPFLASFAFSLFLLHSCYPFLFAILVSSSPVLFCTALLLGLLLCYGEPNIPEIEEDDILNGKTSFLKVENPLDDLFIKKDKSYTLEGLVDSRVGTKGRIFNVSATDGQNERVGDFLAVSSSTDGQNKTGEDYILEQRLVENVGVLMKEQPECNMRMSRVAEGVADGVAVGVDGLTVTINKPDLDEWLDSSLGSPWQPINIHDAASDSESDLAESSSPDASMTDILPMLNELHPLLDSKESKSASNSDVELSQHHESDEGSVEHEDEQKIDGSDASNKVVAWTADDQKNVMDLGSSDLERNRRLESLIARRRARKNQIIIFEKDLIDLHSNDMTVDKLFRFHPHIPPISAPRRNPFYPHHDSEESKDYPPIPGSAPSVLLRRQNPFDFSCDSEDDSKGLAGDNLCQPEFGLPFQRGLPFRRHESFASRSLFPSNVIHEKRGSSSSSRLKPYFVSEMLGLEHNEYVDSDTMSSSIDPEHQNELAEQEMHDRDSTVSFRDTKTTVQIGQSYRDDLVDFEPVLSEDGHFVDPNACAVNEETHQSIDAPGIFKKEIEGEVIASLVLDGQKHELDEEKHDEWTLFTSSEVNEKNPDISLHEALETRGQITSFSEGISESVQSSNAYASRLFCETARVDKSQTEAPIYDYSPSGSGNFIANIYGPDDTLFSSGSEGPNSTSYVESHTQEDVMEVVSHARAFEETITTELMEFEMVHGSKLKDSKSSSGEPVIFSTYINLLDEDMMTTKGVSETGGLASTENRSEGLYEDFGNLATSIEIDQYGFSSREADLNETDFAFPVGLLPPSDVEEKHKSLEKLEMQTSFGGLLEEFQISNLKFGAILEESSDDCLVKEEQVSMFKATIMSSTGSQIFEEPNICKSSVGPKVISLHNQSEEAAVDEEGSEKGIAFLPENAKPSKNFNPVSDNDDMLSGLLKGEWLDRRKSPNLYEMMSEYEFASNDNISDSRACDINDFQTNQNGILTDLNDFYADPGDLNAEVREMQCFDERLLSELDAVGDFRVEGLEPQQCLHMESQSAGLLDFSIEDSELSSADFTDASPKKPIEMHLVLNQRKTKDSGSWSLAMEPVEELELTVYKPKVNVLQAYSLERLYSSSEHDPPGEFAESPLSETIAENFVAEKPHVWLNRCDVSDQKIEAIPHHATLLTPIKKSVEDISSDLIVDERDFVNLHPAPVYFQLNDNHSSMNGCKSILTIVDPCVYDPTEIQSFESKAVHVESVMPFTSRVNSYSSLMDEAETSLTGLDISSKDLEIEEANSELLVVEAKTIKDIDAAFKHASVTILNNSLSSPAIPEPKITYTVDNFVGAMSHEAEKTPGLIFLEAKSIEDIDSAFKEATKEGLATPAFCFSDPESSRTRADFKEMQLSSPDTENLSELFVLEAKSAKDIQLAFKQATEGVSTVPTSPLVDSDLIRANRDLEFVETVSCDNSELLGPEGKLSEDIESAFKQFEIEKMVTHSNVELDDDETGPVNAYKSDDVTSSFQQATDQVYQKSSLETQIDPDLLVLDTKSAESNNLNPALEQDIHDAVGKKSLSAEDKPEISALVTKLFQDAHLDSKNAAAVFLSHSATILLNLKNKPEKEVQDEKYPADCRNASDFHVVEAKSLEDLNLAFERAAKGCLAVSALKDGTDYDTMKENYLGAGSNSEQSAFSDATAGVREGPSSLSADSMPAETHPGYEVEDFKCSKEDNNSEILVIEAGFFNDINSAFELATNMPSFPLLKDARSLDTEGASSSLVFEKKSVNQDDEFMEGNTLGKNDSELLVLEEKSVTIIDSTLKQVTGEFLVRPVTLQDDSKTETIPELQHKDLGLLILEPKPVSDSFAIVRQASEEGSRKTASPRTDESSSQGINQGVEGHGYATTAVESERQHDAEVEYVEVEYAVMGFDETVTEKNSFSEDRFNNRTYEEKNVSEDPSSCVPISLNNQNKGKKSEKSDSGSSSSSSSSDCE